MSAHTIGTPAWYEAHPGAPTAHELALDAAEQQPTRPDQAVVACYPLTIPGQLCTSCWTDHTPNEGPTAA